MLACPRSRRANSMPFARLVVEDGGQFAAGQDLRGVNADCGADVHAVPFAEGGDSGGGFVPVSQLPRGRGEGKREGRRFVWTYLGRFDTSVNVTEAVSHPALDTRWAIPSRRFGHPSRNLEFAGDDCHIR